MALSSSCASRTTRPWPRKSRSAVCSAAARVAKSALGIPFFLRLLRER